MASHQFFCAGMINDSHFDHVDMYLINNYIMFRNSAVQNHHEGEVVGFAIPILLTLVQIRYPAEDLFRTRPIAITLVLTSLLCYCLVLAFGIRIRQRRGHAHARRSFWYRTALTVFGSVSVASLLALLFPHYNSTSLLHPLFFVFFVFVLLGSLVRKLYRHNLVVIRRARPLLPLSFMDFDMPRPRGIVSSEVNYTIRMNENDL